MLNLRDYRCIRVKYLYLKDELDAKEIVDFLYQNHFLNDRQKDKILAEKTRSDRTEILLQILLHSAPESFDIFLQSLKKDHNHIFEKLQETRDIIASLENSSAEVTSYSQPQQTVRADEMHKQSDPQISIRKALKKCEKEINTLKSMDKLHKKTQCIKNPGHQKFIPVKAFNINHLPEHLQKTEIFDLVKAQSCLTVRIGVNIVSSERPKFWPGTQINYPHYNKRNNKFIRNGTGFVLEVIKYVHGNSPEQEKKHLTCPCKDCQCKQSPSDVWVNVTVYTVANLVHDAIEAKETSIRLFFDEDDDDDDEQVVSLSEFTVLERDIEKDFCKLSALTCCKEIIEKLGDQLDTYGDLKSRILPFFKQSPDTSRTVVIVSHPHGGHQQVSIGHLVDKNPLNSAESWWKFKYTTCTCTGTSGALVNVLDLEGASRDYPFLHNDHDVTGLNGSNFGMCRFDLF